MFRHPFLTPSALFRSRNTHLHGGTTSPVLPATVSSCTGGRVSPARRRAPVGVLVSMVTVVGVVRGSRPAPVVPIALRRVRPQRRRTSAFKRRRVASSRRGTTAEHLLPAETLRRPALELRLCPLVTVQRRGSSCEPVSVRVS